VPALVDRHPVGNPTHRTSRKRQSHRRGNAKLRRSRSVFASLDGHILVEPAWTTLPVKDSLRRSAADSPTQFPTEFPIAGQRAVIAVIVMARWGAGTVRRLPSGPYQARVTIDARRISLGTFARGRRRPAPSLETLAEAIGDPLAGDDPHHRRRHRANRRRPPGCGAATSTSSGE
jgi:hypothetical protein